MAVRKRIRRIGEWLGLFLLVSGVFSVGVFVIRLIQLWDLFQYFEEVGKLRSGWRGWALWVMIDVLLVSFQIILGKYLMDKKGKVGGLVVLGSGILAIYMINRLVTDVYVLVNLIV